MNPRAIIEQALNDGKGVVRLAPNWVPRSFCRPGRRLRLHPDDYFALGLARGGIDERWFSSTTPADNGPGTPGDEGLSYIVTADGKKALLIEAVELLGAEVIGEHLHGKYGRWPMFSKFFDNRGPLPHHIHHNDEYAARVGASGKPEMYFFPAQYNNYGAEFPFTFFGINPGVTKDEVKQALIDFGKGDNHLLELSRAYKLTMDTGWDVPPGVLHAPASLCTYEPQFASDVFAMYQSVLYFDHAVPENLLWKNCPEDRIGDYDYLMEVIDWALNVDPNFSVNRFMKPLAVEAGEGHLDEWICYKSPVAGAKRLTVEPGHRVTLRERVPYGLLCVQGHGRIGGAELSAPTMIRFGQLTSDEYFVTESAAKDGVTFENLSGTEPLVVLRHFAEHPDRPQA
ncbi:MAG: hypothetical protein VB067_13380 [Christensenellaceae bacterium]|nr:hypothetical protein [Christensenellaceae bacterium]MEA5069982.1 hypothetical protein [Christensenellaceae bacterium]